MPLWVVGKHSKYCYRSDYGAWNCRLSPEVTFSIWDQGIKLWNGMVQKSGIRCCQFLERERQALTKSLTHRGSPTVGKAGTRFVLPTDWSSSTHPSGSYRPSAEIIGAAVCFGSPSLSGEAISMSAMVATSRRPRPLLLIHRIPESHCSLGKEVCWVCLFSGICMFCTSSILGDG